MFRVHLVVFNPVRLHGTERSHAHMQRQKIMGNGRQQLRRKMQPGRGSGNRSFMPGVNSLVALLVGRVALPVHVMGKRQAAVLFLIHLPVKPDEAVAFPVNAFHGAHRITDGDRTPQLHLAPGAHHALPQQGVEHLCTHHFNGAVIGKIPCGNHPGIIQDEMVPFPHIFRQVAKMPVLNQAGIPVDDHHPGGGAVREGAVRYQLFQQRIIKINGAHGQVHCHESAERSIPLNHR